MGRVIVVGRPREYDEEMVLDQAMSLFWSNGYEATTMGQLLQATGMAKGSLYQAFGDKHQLFHSALDRYLARGRADLRKCLNDAASGFDGLRNWLLENARPNTAGGIRRGCMAVNTAVELAPHGVDTRKVLRAHERQMEKLYEECIGRGHKDGSIRRSVTPTTGAQWITNTIYGLQVRAKLGMSHEQGRETVEQALWSLAGE